MDMNNEEIKNNEKKKDQNTLLMTIVGVATLLVALVGATFAYFTARITNNSTQSVSITTVAPAGLIYTTNKQISIAAANGVPGATDNGTFTIANTAATGTKVQQTYNLDLVVDTNQFNVVATDAADAVANSAGAIKLQDQLNLTVTQSTDGSTTLLIPGKIVVNLTHGSNLTETDDGQGHITETLTSSPSYTITTYATPSATTGTTGSAITSNTITLVQNQLIDVDETHTYNLDLLFKDLDVNQDKNQGRTFTGHIEVNNVKTVNN